MLQQRLIAHCWAMTAVLNREPLTWLTKEVISIIRRKFAKGAIGYNNCNGALQPMGNPCEVPQPSISDFPNGKILSNKSNKTFTDK